MSARPGIIITGAAKRVGAVLSRHFAKHGYDIALHYHASQSDAKKLKNEIESLGAACQLFSLDLSVGRDIPAFMQAIHSAMPHCTALINNASVFERATLMQTDEALFDRQFGINLKAPFFLTQAFAKNFARGSVVNMLDALIKKTHMSHFAYLLSKKSLADFTLMAACELGPDIRVNGICPGIMLPSQGFDGAYMQKLATTLPLQALGTVEQAAAAAQYLCENTAITGQMLFVDGGEHLV